MHVGLDQYNIIIQIYEQFKMWTTCIIIVCVCVCVCVCAVQVYSFPLPTPSKRLPAIPTDVSSPLSSSSSLFLNTFAVFLAHLCDIGYGLCDCMCAVVMCVHVHIHICTYVHMYI